VPKPKSVKEYYIEEQINTSFLGTELAVKQKFWDTVALFS
jgi:hypothetical protein